MFFVDHRFQRSADDFFEVGRGADDGDIFRVQQSLDSVVHFLDSIQSRKSRRKITAADCRVKPPAYQTSNFIYESQALTVFRIQPGAVNEQPSDANDYSASQTYPDDVPITVVRSICLRCVSSKSPSAMCMVQRLSHTSRSFWRH